MPREAKGLSARQAETLGDGKHADGRGLNLIVRGAYRAWFFFYTSPSGRRREMLLDHCSKCSLKDARDKADATPRKCGHGAIRTRALHVKVGTSSQKNSHYD